MKTYVSARYKGSTPKPFIYGKIYDLQMQYGIVGYKVKVTAVRMHNTTKLVAHLSTTYASLADFAMAWDVKAVWHDLEQLAKQKKSAQDGTF